MKKISLNVAILAAFAVLSACGHGETRHEAHWSYEGHGAPAHWGELNPEYQTCGVGQKQSPIDLNAGLAKAGAHQKIVFQYRPSRIRVVNNGHTVQFNYDPGSNAVIDGTSYQLLQFHFHSPSEHTMNGKSYPLEVHLVHKSAGGSLAVIGILFDRGAENASLAALWKVFPQQQGEQVEMNGSFDAASLVPANAKFFTYPGSLTTPPCSEGVLWNVVQAVGPVSADQIEFFRHKFYEGNARPVQPLGQRSLDLY